MTMKEFYDAIDSDYEDAVKRFTCEAILKRIALKFPTDPSFCSLQEEIAAQNTEEAFRAAHTLKGVSANFGFSKLYEKASEITEILRNGDAESCRKASDLLPELETEYRRVIEGIAAIDA